MDRAVHRVTVRTRQENWALGDPLVRRTYTQVARPPTPPGCVVQPATPGLPACTPVTKHNDMRADPAWGAAAPSRVAVDAGEAPPAFSARVSEVGRAHPKTGERVAWQLPKPAHRLLRDRASRAVHSGVPRFRVTSRVAGHARRSDTSPCDARCRSGTGTFRLGRSLGGPPPCPHLPERRHAAQDCIFVSLSSL